MKTIRWGILAPGSIAHQFAKGLAVVPGAALTAVGSRDKGRAEKFGAQYGVAAAHCHGSYEALAADPEVDIVYVASPHNGHKPHTLLCLEHGKAVLCEKPFALNAGEARGMVAAARKHKLFLMEAMWTRFLPVMVQVRRWLKDGRIGDPRMAYADFGFRGNGGPTGRHLNPELAGGGLLDVGIYTLAFAFMAFQSRPDVIQGVADIGTTGVDEQAALALRFPGGRLALLGCAVRTNTPQMARIDGTEGRIVIPQFWRGTEATLTVGGKDEAHKFPLEGNGYNYEAAAAGECLRAGQLESDIMPLDETVALAAAMDTLRKQWGLVYPEER